MPYSPTTWVSGTTAVSAPNMNNIEGGIVAALRADGTVTPSAQQSVIQVDKLATGHQETGFAGFEQSNQSATSFTGAAINFKNDMTNVPSSITLSTVSNSNFPTPTASNIGVHGCTIAAAATSTGGQGWWYGTYQTNGN